MADMMTESIQRAWRVLKLEEPAARDAAKSDFGSVLVIFAIAAIASGIGSMLVTRMMAASPFGILMPSSNIIGNILGGFIGLIVAMFIGVAILWVLIKLLGGSVEYMDLYKGIGHTALAGVLSIVPLLGFIGGIWQIVASITVVKALSGLTTGKAVLAVLLPLLIVVVLFGILIIALGVALFSAASLS